MYPAYNKIVSTTITGNDNAVVVMEPAEGKHLEIRAIRFTVTQPANVQVYYEDGIDDETGYYDVVYPVDQDFGANSGLSECHDFVFCVPADSQVYCDVTYSGTEGVCKMTLMGFEV